MLLYSSVPNYREGRSDSRGGLVKLVKIFKRGVFLGQLLIKVELNKGKWVVKFVEKWNPPYN